MDGYGERGYPLLKIWTRLCWTGQRWKILPGVVEHGLETVIWKTFECKIFFPKKCLLNFSRCIFSLCIINDFFNMLLRYRSGSTHYGIAGWYSAKALEHGMIVSAER